MRRGGLLLGLVLIGLGVVFLLQAVGAFPEDVRVWPILLLALGVVGLLVRATGWWGQVGGLVGPLVLIAIGGTVLLQDLDVVDDDIPVWPVILIAIGLGVLLEGVVRRPQREPSRTAVAVPLEGAPTALVGIRHGAGKLRLSPGAGPGQLVEGEVSGRLESETHRVGERLEVMLRPGKDWGAGPLEWDLNLSPEVPLSLDLRTGAGESIVDLTGLTVEELSLETGASKTEVLLPATGRPRVRVRAGAAGVEITVPQGMAARITARTGMASVEVDEGRFPKVADAWISADYGAADDRAEIDIEGGAAGFKVR